MRGLIVGIALSGLLLAACSSDIAVFPRIASSPGSVGVGVQRVMVALTDFETGDSLASPDIEVVATLRDDTGSPLDEYVGEFVWLVPEVRGLYAFHMDIPGPGTFQITMDAGRLGELGPVGLVTVDDPPVISPGDEAPRSETRTSADVDLVDLTSDHDPDPSFYELTVTEAVESGASVIIFATPAWCTSETCGPLLEQVKELSAGFPTLNYVHVEVYENIHVSSFDELILVPSVADWSLPSEPWVFVTDADGVVFASFEGAASDDELSRAFEAVSR
ncbi:MAG: hypothetical protein V3U46_11640 [Acidimicrobiia bacterium]